MLIMGFFTLLKKSSCLHPLHFFCHQPEFGSHNFCDKNKATLKDTGDREGNEEAEEDEHDVVDREGSGDAADNLDEAGYENAGPPSELVTGPAPEDAA